MFLETVLTGEQNLVVIARKAYAESLKKYHSWIVRGLFAVRAVLYYCIVNIYYYCYYCCLYYIVNCEVVSNIQHIHIFTEE